MSNIVTYKGVIHFDPKDKTNKHVEQSAWKKMALILIPGEVCEYYSWFLYKRYGIILNKPLRGAHISFINDSIRDIKSGSGVKEHEVEPLWNCLKERWDGKEIDIVLDLNPKSDASHWWFNIPEDDRKQLHDIRSAIGLDRPHWGLHMSIGYANDLNREHSEYIRSICTKYGNEYL